MFKKNDLITQSLCKGLLFFFLITILHDQLVLKKLFFIFIQKLFIIIHFLFSQEQQ